MAEMASFSVSVLSLLILACVTGATHRKGMCRGSACVNGESVVGRGCGLCVPLLGRDPTHYKHGDVIVAASAKSRCGTYTVEVPPRERTVALADIDVWQSANCDSQC